LRFFLKTINYKKEKSFAETVTGGMQLARKTKNCLTIPEITVNAYTTSGRNNMHVN